MPTILDVLEIDPPDGQMQGESLRPLWETQEGRRERIAYTEGLVTANEKKSLRTSRFKYILNVRPGLVREYGRACLPARPLRAQLFDLAADPGERVNLLRDGRDPAVKAMAEQFDRTLRDHVATSQGRAKPTHLSDEALEKLRALGYLE
jgi:arylsulfatase A-like enzyme